MTAVRVWDLPTRLFHWLLALCIVGSIVSAKIGGNAMDWHMRLGTVVFTLLVFRLLWGLFGGRWSRFASFIYAPGTLLRYLRGRHRDDEHLDVGHSPVGALSVFAMLVLLAAQVGTGLFADDKIFTVGPLNVLVSNATASSATAWHKDFGQWLILALIALHLVANGYYAWRGRKLVRAMVRGDKRLPAYTPASTDNAARRLLALALLALSAGIVAAVLSLGS